MRRTRAREAMPPELQLAIGLVWGHLNAYQYEEAYELALGCLQLWPDEARLQLMCDHAAAEVMEPVDIARLRSLRDAGNADWVELVLRRVQYQSQKQSQRQPQNQPQRPPRPALAPSGIEGKS